MCHDYVLRCLGYASQKMDRAQKRKDAKGPSTWVLQGNQAGHLRGTVVSKNFREAPLRKSVGHDFEVRRPMAQL